MSDDNSKNDKTRGIIQFRFKPGQSGNPGGSAKGYRKKLSAAFLRELAADFDEHGAATIIKAREADPLGYARMVAGLLPKEIDLANPFDGIPDAELNAMLEYLRGSIAAATGAAEADEAA